MISEFFRFFDSMIDRGYFMHLEVGYNKIADYCIRVYRKGMGKRRQRPEYGSSSGT